MTLSQGDRLGRYEILGPIGAGGMGEVWRARDTELDRQVAVKVLPAEVADSPERRKRFEREARATAGLNHPNLLTIHDVGIEDGRPFIVTELLEGETLRRMLRNSLPSYNMAVEWSLAVVHGLTAAHAKAIVHRDIKPDNLFLTTDNRVKILDFGLAKILEADLGDEDETAALSTDTEAGTLLGTLGYMAPEQLRGEPVDPRTDVFCFGCVLFEMLTGRRPFAGGSSAEQVSAVLRGDPPPLDDAIPLSLRSIVRRCLEKRSAARYQSAGEVAAALEAIDPSALGRTPGEQPSISISPASSSGEPAVAVMPFANMSGDPEQEYFCDGMAEEILGAIGKVRGLKVLARSSSFSFKGKEADPRQVGTTIGADHLLEGSIQRAGDRIRISARLVQARDGTQLWADRYDRTISDIFELQDEISAEVANQLRTTLLPDELSNLKRRHIPDREAYDLFIRGRYLWFRREPGDMTEAVRLYEQAIEKDPGYPKPHIGIADVYNALGYWDLKPARAVYARSRAEITTALELDDRLAEAHAAAGFIAAYHDFDFGAGERYLRKAIQLEPTAAHFRCWLSNPLMLLGRFEEGISEIERAVELEPMSAVIQSICGANLSIADPELGLERARIAYELEPQIPITGCALGMVLGQFGGRYEEALAPLEQSAAAGWPWSLGMLGSCLWHLGLHERAAEVEAKVAQLAEEDYVSPTVHAYLAAGRGDVDATLNALEDCAEQGVSLALLYSEVRSFELVHDHPRSCEILRRIGLASSNRWRAPS